MYSLNEIDHAYYRYYITEESAKESWCYRDDEKLCR
jgi:hypothetical protein